MNKKRQLQLVYSEKFQFIASRYVIIANDHYKCNRANCASSLTTIYSIVKKIN